MTDRKDAVTLDQVAKTVRAYVAMDTVEKLVVYFSGHGYLNGNSEIWLLSGAPENANEAIDLTESAELARASGIPSIIFISDACRSTPQTLGALRVRVIDLSEQRARRDRSRHRPVLRLAAVETPALELPLDEAQKNYGGLFTELLRQAHANPPPDHTRRVTTASGSFIVVPNRKLKERFPALVAAEAGRRKLRVPQPQLRLECGDETFIARAFFQGGGGFDGAALAEPAEPTLEQVVRGEPTGSFAALPPADDTLEAMVGVAAPTKLAAFASEVRRQAASDVTRHFETETGFQVRGSAVRAVTGIGVGAALLSPDLISVHHSAQRPATGRRSRPAAS